MKLLPLPLLLLLISFSYAQDATLQRKVNELKTQIQSEKDSVTTLKLLTKLTHTVRNKKELGYDSIVLVTIDYAIALDSFDIAARNTGDLINYYNNTIGKPDTGISIYDTYFSRLQNNISDKYLTRLHIDAGDAFYFTQEPDSALAHYDQAIFYAEKSGEERLKALATSFQGVVYFDEGNSTKASQAYQEASKIFYKVKDTLNIIGTKNELANLYSAHGFIAEAQQERKEGIELAEKIEARTLLTVLYINESGDNKKLGEEKNRIIHLHKAIEANKHTDFTDYYNPLLLGELAVAYAENDSVEKARFYLNKMTQEKENTEGIYKETYYKALKSMAFAEKDYIKAKQLGKTHMEIVSASNMVYNIQNARKFLYKVYEKLDETTLAFSQYKIYKETEDSIQSVQKSNALSYFQTLYETAKRDKKIEEQDAKIKILGEQNKRKKQSMWLGGLLLIGVFSTIYFWRSRNFSHRRAQLEKVFAQDLIRNVEAERKRISSELHDSIGQSLLLIKNKVVLDADNNTDTTLIDNTIDEVRNLSQRLHPFQFEKLGLIASIKSTVNNFQKNSKVFYSEDIEITYLNIDKSQKIFVYRMIQECLNNVEKHSQAKACKVSIKQEPKTVLFQVKDNGVGFDPTENSELVHSLGLKTLQERAKIVNAQLIISSVKGEGTTIQIKVPKK